ncbi:MAG: SCO family protein [Planctomycetota bacterium]
MAFRTAPRSLTAPGGLRTTLRYAACLGVGVGLAWMSAVPAAGQSRVGPQPLGNTAPPMPAEVAAVEMTQKLGSMLPLDTPFIDQLGRPVRLGDYFDGDRPVVLQFAYYECPLSCPLMFEGVLEAARSVGPSSEGGGGGLAGAWLPGEDYTIVTISINPDDDPPASLEKRQGLVDRLEAGDEARGLPPAPSVADGVRGGWHFLTGRELDIRAVTDAAGFGYAAVPGSNDFAHPTVVTFASPRGVVTRYLPGNRYDPQDFRLALTEASEGRQGSLFDRVLQLCYVYDDAGGRYTASAMAFMQLGGAVTVITLGGVIAGMLVFERRRKRRLAAEDQGHTPSESHAPTPQPKPA